jgi:hypothetical protein
MRHLSICLAVIAMLMASGTLSADSLNFPTNQAEIVKALSPDEADKKETSVEAAYKFDQNKVYKIINAKGACRSRVSQNNTCHYFQPFDN